MNALLIASVILLYFALLMWIGKITTQKKNTNSSFFNAEKKSPWYLIAFGMIGTSISGVTFISVPGEVGLKSFAYLQIIMGNLIGYLTIIYVLLPLYYKLNLTSIYTYLDTRFGTVSHRTGSSFFLLSRTIGCAARLYLVVMVFQKFIFDAFGFPFYLSAILSIGLILVYSIKGGVKTIIYTDTIQTVFLVLSLILSIFFINHYLNLNLADSFQKVMHSPYSKIFFWDSLDNKYFWKQFVSGIFLTIAMTGLDQDLMQKNLTCKSLKEAQKNMLVFSFVFMAVVFLFLFLGALLFEYANIKGIAIPTKTDELFPLLAVNYFPPLFGVIFIIGLTAAAFASADSALTSLTTCFCLDILKLDIDNNSALNKRKRYGVHIGFSVLILLVIFLLNLFADGSTLSIIFKLASFTYGPLLALFGLGIITKTKVIDWFSPIACTLGVICSFILDRNSQNWLNGYKFGFELLLVNALIIICLMILFKALIGSEKFKNEVSL
jgi:SSS family transporter